MKNLFKIKIKDKASFLIKRKHLNKLNNIIISAYKNINFIP